MGERTCGFLLVAIIMSSTWSVTPVVAAKSADGVKEESEELPWLQQATAEALHGGGFSGFGFAQEGTRKARQILADHLAALTDESETVLIGRATRVAERAVDVCEDEEYRRLIETFTSIYAGAEEKSWRDSYLLAKEGLRYLVVANDENMVRSTLALGLSMTRRKMESSRSATTALFVAYEIAAREASLKGWHEAESMLLFSVTSARAHVDGWLDACRALDRVGRVIATAEGSEGLYFSVIETFANAIVRWEERRTVLIYGLTEHGHLVSARVHRVLVGYVVRLLRGFDNDSEAQLASRLACYVLPKIAALNPDAPAARTVLRAAQDLMQLTFEREYNRYRVGLWALEMTQRLDVPAEISQGVSEILARAEGLQGDNHLNEATRTIQDGILQLVQS